MASLPPLANLIAFETVARRRSFSLAATELHLTPSAISHQVSRLEAHLGVRLFERSAHGVKLSPAGQSFLNRIGGALTAITSAADDLRHGTSNSLYIHCSPSFAILWLMPRLAKFREAQPSISLNLSAAHTHSDFALGNVDIDIRYGLPQWPELIVEPIFEEKITALANCEFIRSHGLNSLARLRHVPLIQSNVNVVQWSDWFTEYIHERAPEQFALRFDRAQMSLDAASQGLGVALESLTIAQSYIKSGQLTAVYEHIPGVNVKAHFAVYPQRHLKRKPVQIFLDWLKAEAVQSI